MGKKCLESTTSSVRKHNITTITHKVGPNEKLRQDSVQRRRKFPLFEREIPKNQRCQNRERYFYGPTDSLTNKEQCL